jgi:hypothetical protein
VEKRDYFCFPLFRALKIAKPHKLGICGGVFLCDGGGDPRQRLPYSTLRKTDGNEKPQDHKTKESAPGTQTAADNFKPKSKSVTKMKSAKRQK